MWLSVGDDGLSIESAEPDWLDALVLQAYKAYKLALIQALIDVEEGN